MILQGGVSVGSWELDEGQGIGIFNGTVKDVPALSAPGFYPPMLEANSMMHPQPYQEIWFSKYAVQQLHIQGSEYPLQRELFRLCMHALTAAKLLSQMVALSHDSKCHQEMNLLKYEFRFQVSAIIGILQPETKQYLAQMILVFVQQKRT